MGIRRVGAMGGRESDDADQPQTQAVANLPKTPDTRRRDDDRIPARAGPGAASRPTGFVDVLVSRSGLAGFLRRAFGYTAGNQECGNTNTAWAHRASLSNRLKKIVSAGGTTILLVGGSVGARFHGEIGNAGLDAQILAKPAQHFAINTLHLVVVVTVQRGAGDACGAADIGKLETARAAFCPTRRA